MEATTPRLSDAQLGEMLALVRQADSVELKLTIAPDTQRAALAALGLDPLDARLRMVYFFDTPDLRLDAAGVVVRARRVQNRGDDSVVKLRPVDPAELSESVRESGAFGVEVDAMPGGFVCSGSMKARPRTAVRDVAQGLKPVRKLFTKEQRALYAEHAPDDIGLDDLSILGPVFVLKLKGSPPDFGRLMVVEAWLYPDGTRIIELSTKCDPGEAFQVAAEARAFLAACGVEADDGQRTKTRTALTHFAAQLS